MNPEPIISWMRERQRIYRKKEAGEPRPWTTDAPLNSYRFCNVFRELDKVTIWIRENWREPFKDDINICFAMGVARFFNKISTLEYLGYPRPWDIQEAIGILSHLQTAGHNIFSAAYIISPCGSNKPKINRVVEDYLTPFFIGSRKCIVDNSLEKTWKNICSFEGFGPFMAYEVVSDLRWTPRLINAPDIYTWANPGPGAKRGLNRLLGVPAKSPLNGKTMLAMMQELLGVCQDALKDEDEMFQQLEMRDIEHSLCETDKWLRAKSGEGRPKENY